MMHPVIHVPIVATENITKPVTQQVFRVRFFYKIEAIFGAWNLCSFFGFVQLIILRRPKIGRIFSTQKWSQELI
jgi:hypothetical protein